MDHGISADLWSKIVFASEKVKMNVHGFATLMWVIGDGSDSVNKPSVEIQTLAYFDTLVLNIDRVVRLVGCALDEYDYYWVFKQLGKDPVIFSSCCGGFIPLKSQLSVKDYEFLNKMMTLNGAEPEPRLHLWRRV